MKKLAISVILGSLLCTGNVMSSENYKPREFWDNKEVVKSTLEQTFIIAQSKIRGIRFDCSDGRDHTLAANIAIEIYPLVTNFIEQNCLEALSMDDFLISLGLHKPEGEPISMEKIWDFLDHVGNILDRKLY